MSAGPFIVTHHRTVARERLAPRAEIGDVRHDPVVVFREAVIDWEDRIATMGLWPPLVANGVARQPDGSVVEVERVGAGTLAKQSGWSIERMVHEIERRGEAEARRVVCAAWNARHGIPAREERAATDGSD